MITAEALGFNQKVRTRRNFWELGLTLRCTQGQVNWCKTKMDVL
jgi:hypothetical protein